MKKRTIGYKSFAARHLRSERGIALVTALLVMGVMAVLGAAIITTTTTDVKIASNVTRSTQAFMVAEAGISNAIDYLRDDASWGPDLDGDGDTVDDQTAWLTQSQGTIQMGGNINGLYTLYIYDESGTNGRLANSARTDKYTTLGGDDVLLEVTGTVGGITRKIGLVIRTSISAFDYASYSDSYIIGTGAGSMPGTFIGKLYARDNLNLQGNYDMSEAEAESMTQITPNCESDKFKTCDDSADEIEPPVLDFPYYQDQANFADQQVFLFTPTVGSVTSCGANCSEWPINYEITTLGTTYTVTATTQAIESGNDWNHTVYWCSDPNWTGGTGNCPDATPPNTFTFTADNAESSKPFIDAYQFNAYTAYDTTEGYTSSVVNVFDATAYLEFMGPPVGETATVTASILVGTATNNTEPEGGIYIEGGEGTLNFQPANGLAIVAADVVFKAKYSSIIVNVGTATDGAVIMGTDKFEVEADTPYTMDFSMNGSIVVGNGEGDGEFKIGGNGVTANFTYTPISPLPEGWQDYGTISISRREWREL
jgi:type II secretory pathway pseudopilin PulG